MDKGEIEAKISQAIEMTKELAEPYKSGAFQVIFEKLINESTRSSSITGDSAQISLKGMQANEFLASLDLKSQLDQLEAVAYYFLKSGQESVTRTEFMDTLSKARLPRPRNLSDVVGKCIRKGHIIEAAEPKDGPKALQITPSGEKYIEEKLKPQGKK